MRWSLEQRVIHVAEKKSDTDSGKTNTNINRLREGWWIILMCFLKDLVNRFSKGHKKPSGPRVSTRHKEEPTNIVSSLNQKVRQWFRLWNCSLNEFYGCLVMDALENGGQCGPNWFSKSTDCLGKSWYVMCSFNVYFWGAPEQSS